VGFLKGKGEPCQCAKRREVSSRLQVRYRLDNTKKKKNKGKEEEEIRQAETNLDRGGGLVPQPKIVKELTTRGLLVEPRNWKKEGGLLHWKGNSVFGGRGKEGD